MVEDKNNMNSNGSRGGNTTSDDKTGSTRRQFLGHAGAAAALVAGALKAPPSASGRQLSGSSSGVTPEATPKSVKKRIARATALRKGRADQDAGVRAVNV